MSNPKRFILLGDAGAGKSSFINLLYNHFYGTRETNEIFCEYPQVKLAIPCANWLDCLDEKYKDNHSERDINDQTQSQTWMCTSYSFKTPSVYLQIIDTPGFNDTNGTDIDGKNLSFIEKALKEVPFLSGIIMVVNGAVPRLGTSFKNFLHLLHQVWPNDLLNNCLAVLTNCDELTATFDPSILRRNLNVDDGRIFHIQNSLFRWDCKNYSSKTIRRYRQDFEDNLEKIDELVSKLLQFKDVSTEAFQIGAIKILVIEKCVTNSVHDMIQLLHAFKEQQAAEVGIEAAQHTMESNKEWSKHQEINAIKWVEVSRCRSPSPQQSKSKFTRQSFLSDQSKTASPTNSLKDCKLYTSKSDSDPQEQCLSHTTNYSYPPSKAHSIHSDGGRSSQQRQSTSSQKANNYSSAYNLGPYNEQPITPLYSSKTSASHYATVAGRKDDKVEPSSLSDDHYKQHDSYSPISSTNLYSNTTSSKEPVYRQEKTRIQVIIPDNEARSHHGYAQEQEFALQKRKRNLIHQQKVLSTSMSSLLQHLKEYVAELRSINKNYDLIERNHELLIVFNEIIKVLGDEPEMKNFYDQTVNILSNKKQ